MPSLSIENSHRISSICIAILFGCLVEGCQPTNNVVVPPRPALAPAYSEPWDLNKFLALMSPTDRSLIPTDPDLCPTPATPDKGEVTIGGLSSRSVLSFETQPVMQDLYARLIITMKVCTADSLSSTDRTAFTAILNFLKVTNAKSFAATISVTGDGQGGVKYPQLVPFSYSYDESKSTYSVQTIGQAVVPWQVTTSFDVQYAYNASKDLSIDTSSLFSSIVTSISGAGSATSLLSPAANAYLSAGNAVLQELGKVFKAINTGSDSFHLDIVGAKDRSVTYRFRDLKNRPLAAVRLTVAVTNTIQNPVPVDPTSGGQTIPQFSGLQDILGVSVGGPLMGTLLQAISKETSYQNLLKSTSDTSAASLASDCNNLEGALQSVYGLNTYDAALAMGEILSQNTLYLRSKKFYTSGCFRNRGMLKKMGINDFEQAPST
jgi:hypothetical protein